jgi:small-conductance mechanosensitive channel
VTGNLADLREPFNMQFLDSLRKLFQQLGADLYSVVADSNHWQLGAVVLALAAGVATALRLRGRIDRQARSEPRHATAIVAPWLARVTAPLVVFLSSLAAYAALRWAQRPADWLLQLASLSALLLAVRVGVYAFIRFVLSGPLMSAAERFISWVAWAVLALMVVGWLRPVNSALDAVALPVAGARISLLDAMRGALVLLCFVLGASYVGAFVERRLMAVEHLPIGLRVGTAKATRVALIIISIIVALNAFGLNMGAFTVVGGALGVGVGFGLQRIMSNFISGFILLGDRSIRPGDVITIGQRFGIVRELRARYVVVRDRDGVDTLIPNENIITSEVINWSYADRNIRLKLPVQISYADDPRQAIMLMETVARAHPRVAPAPAPAGRVTAFGESGIALELRYWIRDPEDGINNVRSDLYLAIWDAFRGAGITIPFPQRDVHIIATDGTGGRHLGRGESRD